MVDIFKNSPQLQAMVPENGLLSPMGKKKGSDEGGLNMDHRRESISTMLLQQNVLNKG